MPVWQFASFILSCLTALNIFVIFTASFNFLISSVSCSNCEIFSWLPVGVIILSDSFGFHGFCAINVPMMEFPLCSFSSGNCSLFFMSIVCELLFKYPCFVCCCTVTDVLFLSSQANLFLYAIHYGSIGWVDFHSNLCTSLVQFWVLCSPSYDDFQHTSDKQVVQNNL